MVWRDGSRFKSSVLFFQRTQVRFPASTWWFKAISNYSPMGSNVLFRTLKALQAHGAQTNIQANTHPHKIKIKVGG